MTGRKKGGKKAYSEVPEVFYQKEFDVLSVTVGHHLASEPFSVADLLKIIGQEFPRVHLSQLHISADSSAQINVHRIGD